MSGYFTKEASIKGAAASAKLQRDRAEKSYYENPNFCEFCHEMIVLKPHEPVHVTKQHRFCSLTCASRYRANGKKDVNAAKPKRSARYHHSSEKKHIFCDMNLRAKGDVRGQQINAHARKVYDGLFTYQNQICCELCGWKLHIDVAHIKPIAAFDSLDLLAEINNPKNLIGLCPNCHWSFDHGHIDVSIINEKAARRG